MEHTPAQGSYCELATRCEIHARDSKPMHWRQVVFSSNDVLNGKHKALQDAFAALFTAAPIPGAALFAPSFAMDRNHYPVFLSPAAAAIAGGLLGPYESTPCEGPSEDAVLLVGQAAEGHRVPANGEATA